MAYHFLIFEVETEFSQFGSDGEKDSNSSPFDLYAVSYASLSKEDELLIILESKEGSQS